MKSRLARRRTERRSKRRNLEKYRRNMHLRFNNPIRRPVLTQNLLLKVKLQLINCFLTLSHEQKLSIGCG